MADINTRYRLTQETYSKWWGVEAIVKCVLTVKCALFRAPHVQSKLAAHTSNSCLFMQVCTYKLSYGLF